MQNCDTINRRLWKKLTPELFDIILSYTHRPQPESLRADIINFCEVSKKMVDSYTNFWVNTWSSTLEDAYDWLSNDIVRFVNEEQGTMFGFTKNFYDVCMRNPRLNTREDVDRFHDRLSILYDVNQNHSRTVFFTFLGLLTTQERIEFMKIYGDERSMVF